MQRDELLRRVKSALEEAFPKRLRGVILYGSEARGEADPDSDIDLLVLLDGQTDFWADIRVCIHALFALSLEADRPIDATPVDFREYEAQEWALYQNVKKEGLPA